MRCREESSTDEENSSEGEFKHEEVQGVRKLIQFDSVIFLHSTLDPIP